MDFSEDVVEDGLQAWEFRRDRLLQPVLLLTVLMSMIVLIFGELFPKRFAMLHAEGMAMAVCGPNKFHCSPMFKPVVIFLSANCKHIAQTVQTAELMLPMWNSLKMM